jgi:DNA replication protein DnaC
MDLPTQFNGEIKCGIYYVNTKQAFPFRGCGWYNQPLVQYGIDNELIELKDIHLEFIPSNTLPYDYFKSHIDYLLQVFECEPSLQKISFNSYVGLMGRTKNVACSSKFTTCSDEASNWLCDEKKEVFIRNHELKNVNVFQGIFSEEVAKETSTIMIYNHILSLEALELHKLETLIINNGGVCLDRNTDAIRYYADEEIILNEYYDDNKTVCKYKIEEPNELKCSHLGNQVRSHNLDYQNKFILPFNITNDYTDINGIIDSNKSVHIDGRAGCGKTYLTNGILKELKTRGIIYKCFSPTNKGARLIDGNTIHSLYNKYKRNKTKLEFFLGKVEYIVIDEISMMGVDFYNLFLMIKKMFKDI